MKNSYSNLSAAQIAALQQALANQFNNEQLAAIYSAFDTLLGQAATATTRGTVLQAASFANIGAAPSQTNFNDLLARLRTAGVIAP